MSQTAKDVLQIYGLGVADAAAFINANLKKTLKSFSTRPKNSASPTSICQKLQGTKQTSSNPSGLRTV
jgi:hypothetical protein